VVLLWAEKMLLVRGILSTVYIHEQNGILAFLQFQNSVIEMNIRHSTNIGCCHRLDIHGCCHVKRTNDNDAED